MPIDKSKITREMLEKALHCNTPEELIAIAKTQGIEITKDEAEAYFAELSEFELKDGELQRVAGGLCGNDIECPSFCPKYSPPY